MVVDFTLPRQIVQPEVLPCKNTVSSGAAACLRRMGPTEDSAGLEIGPQTPPLRVSVKQDARNSADTRHTDVISYENNSIQIHAEDRSS